MGSRWTDLWESFVESCAQASKHVAPQALRWACGHAKGSVQELMLQENVLRGHAHITGAAD